MACTTGRLARLLVLVAMAWVTACSAACTTGVLRMKPFPNRDYDDCFAGAVPTANSIKALCNVAVKVEVTSSGILKWEPLVKDTYGYGGPGPYTEVTNMNCKEHNASGLFRTAARSAATIMFYDDVGGPLSNLSKISATEVSLSLGSTYSYQGPTVDCTYNYTVVSGCVLGAKPPPKVAPCPAGYIVKTGTFATKYCAPCPAGKSSPGPNSVSCTPCAAGTYGANYGGKCRGCDDNGYAPKAGTSQCEYCSREYENKWSDGKRCVSCPAGSYASTAVKSQCIKCAAGKKCCTVNWTSPSGSCPKCTAAGGSKAPLTSIFVLDSASSPSCLASNHSRCAPKFQITIDDKCSVSLSNSGYASPLGQYQLCDWQTSQAIQGAKLNALVDLAGFSGWDTSDYSLLAGNLTAASSGHLTFRIPSTKCVLKYRALTKPAAALLGVLPTPCPLGTPGCPSKASTCPAGSYLETASAAKPAPCILCRPGTYSNKASSGAPCTPCPRGTYARSYGSTKCTKCPAGIVAVNTGSAICVTCDNSFSSYASSPSKCTACPNNTNRYYSGLSSCLGNADGNVCCAAGKCAGQPRCPSSLPFRGTDPDRPYPAVMQLVKRSLPLPACKDATVLSCLPDKAQVQLVLTDTASPTSLSISLLQAPKCVDQGYPININGGYTTPQHAYVQLYLSSGPFGYGLASDKAKGTITMYLSKYLDYEKVPDVPPMLHSCSATFKLVAGYAFDLSPPAGAKCPPNAITRTVNGRTFCEFCTEGLYKNATGACDYCPKGKYQNLSGATACKPCPAGTSCYSGTFLPQPCQKGSYNAKVGAAECSPCPKNTFSGREGAKQCSKCPSPTKAPPGSQACGVFW